MDFRFEAGETITVETYLAMFPDLATDRHTLLQLITQEFGLRARRDKGLGLDDCLRRFPDLSEDLRVQWQAKPSNNNDPLANTLPYVPAENATPLGLHGDVGPNFNIDVGRTKTVLVRLNGIITTPQREYRGHQGAS